MGPISSMTKDPQKSSMSYCAGFVSYNAIPRFSLGEERVFATVVVPNLSWSVAIFIHCSVC